MAGLYSMECCGVQELDGIITSTSSKSIIADVVGDFFHDDSKCTYIIFTDYSKNRNGDNLKKYIEKNKLGTVTKQRAKRNPNSKNIINLFVWSINQNNLKRLHRKICDCKNNSDGFIW